MSNNTKIRIVGDCDLDKLGKILKKFRGSGMLLRRRDQRRKLQKESLEERDYRLTRAKSLARYLRQTRTLA